MKEVGEDPIHEAFSCAIVNWVYCKLWSKFIEGFIVLAFMVKIDSNNTTVKYMYCKTMLFL